MDEPTFEQDGSVSKRLSADNPDERMLATQEKMLRIFSENMQSPMAAMMQQQVAMAASRHRLLLVRRRRNHLLQGCMQMGVKNRYPKRCTKCLAQSIMSLRGNMGCRMVFVKMKERMKKAKDDVHLMWGTTSPKLALNRGRPLFDWGR